MVERAMRTALCLWVLTAALARGRGAALLCAHARCRYLGSAGLQHRYEVDGAHIKITLLEKLVKLDCGGDSVLGSEALPRAEPALHVASVVLARCPLPTALSLAAALAALHVAMPQDCRAPHDPCGYLELEGLPRAPPLAATHLAGLGRLTHLKISGGRRSNTVPEFLTPLRNLRWLKISPAVLYADELEPSPVPRAPAGGDDRIPMLSTLETIILEEWVASRPEPLERCDALRTLRLVSPDVAALPHAWLANCPLLADLTIIGANIIHLPQFLLVGAHSLTRLTLAGGALAGLPADLLHYSPDLRELQLNGNRLTTLPSGAFGAVRRLQELDLSGNELDSGVMAVLAALAEQLTALNLENNPRLGDCCAGNGYSPIRNATKLRKLVLAGSRVSRICRDWRENMPLLELLDLSRTNVTALTTLGEILIQNGGDESCTEVPLGVYSSNPSSTGTRLWVAGVVAPVGEMKVLIISKDSQHSAVTWMKFEDFQWTRSVQARVALWGAPLAAVQTSREQFHSAARSLSPNTDVSVIFVAGVDLDHELHEDSWTASETSRQQPGLTCDCRMYWTRRALELALPALRHVGELLCSDGRALRDVPPEELVCARPDVCAAAALPPACVCDERPDDDPTRARRLARVRCEPASLARMPRLPALPSGRRYELLLPYNNVAELRADDLPDHVTSLDLRNNSLRAVDEETAGRLGAMAGMVRLAGNPLECSCRAAPLLRALSARNATRTDFINASCSDGRPLHSAFTMNCQQSALAAMSFANWLSSALAALLALVVAGAACLWSRQRRFFARAVLHRWGLAWRAADPEDDGRRYDAFVTFSHKDSAAALELVARLEPAYRLCVHYRDWVPGCLIPAQIVASVHESRRTVALVSRHFLESTWARAEFREAHAAAMLEARPRLVVVLLEEPSELQMDAQLRRYVATHTYLRWGDPWFWDKLAVALPSPPRAPPPAGACSA